MLALTSESNFNKSNKNIYKIACRISYKDTQIRNNLSCQALSNGSVYENQECDDITVR